MTTLTAPETPTRATFQPVSAHRLSFGRLLRAEWIKFTTVRSTWWSFGLVALVSVGLSLLQAVALASFAAEDMAGATAAEANGMATMTILFATILTQLLAVIIGTITVTGEYSTGMIRSTLTAAPARIGSLLAKALIVATTVFVFSLIVFALAALATGPILPAGFLDLSDPETSIMPLLGGALYLALVSAMGVGLGFVIRNGPGALALGISLIFVAPILVMFFPQTEQFAWVQDAAAYLPSNAGQSLFMGAPLSGSGLETWPAIIALVVWAVALIAAGAGVLKARDA